MRNRLRIQKLYIVIILKLFYCIVLQYILNGVLKAINTLNDKLM